MKSIIGKIVDADLTVMNRFEKIVYGVTMFLVGMAGAFFGMYTLVFVSEASGLATYDTEDDFAGRLVVASSVCISSVGSSSRRFAQPDSTESGG